MTRRGRLALLIAGDVFHHSIIGLTFPDQHFMGDHDPEMAVKTRREILEKVVSEWLRLQGFHLPFPGIGHVRK